MASQGKVSTAFPQRKQRQAHVVTKGGKNTGNDASSSGSLTQKDDSEKVLLKAFDLTLEYGPCIGITRLERWERAQKHELNPPQEVYDILQKHIGDDSYTENLWSGYSTLN